MAEIDIEKKNGNGKIWLWIIIALIVAALLYWWLTAEKDEGIEETETEQIEDETVMKDDSQTTFWEKEVQKS